MNPDENTVAAPKTRKPKEVYNRAVVQLVDAAGPTFKIVEDLGPVPTLKAQQAKRKLEKAGQTNLAVIYWVG
jgi:hypothetical protein